jgi:hypothetical protein
MIAARKVIIPSGARIPVRTNTAAKGNRNTAKGICNRSETTIIDFSFHGRVALGGGGVDAAM